MKKKLSKWVAPLRCIVRSSYERYEEVRKACDRPLKNGHVGKVFEITTRVTERLMYELDCGHTVPARHAGPYQQMDKVSSYASVMECSACPKRKRRK